MWRQFLKDYFTFTRKERTGIVAMLALIVILWVLPEFFETTRHTLTPIQIEEFKSQSSKLESKVHLADSNDHDVEIERKTLINTQSTRKIPAAELFEFDPNTLSSEGWRSLGLKEKTIVTIRNYLAKGGHFYEPRDMGKIYGLTKGEYERLLPFVRIRERERTVFTKIGHPDTGFRTKERPQHKPFLPSNYMVDINAADSAELVKLPGIGPGLSARIIIFRNRLGGFYDVRQLAETYGLADSAFQKIKHRLVVAPDFAVTTININTADLKTLQGHPYISFAMANAIIQFRSQHGLFKSLNDIQKITLITQEWLDHIRPYLTI